MKNIQTYGSRAKRHDGRVWKIFYDLGQSPAEQLHQRGLVKGSIIIYLPLMYNYHKIPIYFLTNLVELTLQGLQFWQIPKIFCSWWLSLFYRKIYLFLVGRTNYRTVKPNLVPDVTQCYVLVLLIVYLRSHKLCISSFCTYYSLLSMYVSTK